MVDKTKNQTPIQNDFEKAHSFMNVIKMEKKRRKREDRRHRAVEWAGGICAFVGVNGLFFILLHRLRIFELLFDNWGLGYSISAGIIVILWLGFAFLVASAFFWLSDKSGLHYLIEDWIVSYHKYKKFPRNERKAFIRDTREKLDEIFERLYRLEWKADETGDEKLSESVESLNQVIGTLVTEADISSRSLINQPEHASWRGFVLALEETSNDLELELKNITRYHSKIQPLLNQAANITSNVHSAPFFIIL